MVKFLTQVLGPIFTGLGVSGGNLKSYITQLQGYIYVILVALVVMIVVLFAASKAKKRLRHVWWQAVLAFVAVIAVIANVICYGPMYTNVSGFLNASKINLSEATVKQSKETIKK